MFVEFINKCFIVKVDFLFILMCLYFCVFWCKKCYLFLCCLNVFVIVSLGKEKYELKGKYLIVLKIFVC